MNGYFFLPDASLWMTVDSTNKLLLMYPVYSFVSSSDSLSLPARSTKLSTDLWRPFCLRIWKIVWEREEWSWYFFSL